MMIWDCINPDILISLEVRVAITINISSRMKNESQPFKRRSQYDFRFFSIFAVTLSVRLLSC